MSTDKGYVKIYRDIRDHDIWQEKPFDRARAWIDLIMMVNHEDRQVLFDGKFVPVYRGMCVTSIRRLAERWGWSQGKTSRFLNELETQCMIRQERNAKRSTVSIVNYDIYQTSQSTKRSTDGALTVHRRSTDGDKQDIIEGIIEDTKKNTPQTPLKLGDPVSPEKLAEWEAEGWTL